MQPFTGFKNQISAKQQEAVKIKKSKQLDFLEIKQKNLPKKLSCFDFFIFTAYLLLQIFDFKTSKRLYHDNRKNIYKNMSMIELAEGLICRFKPWWIVSIVGPSGSGKKRLFYIY